MKSAELENLFQYAVAIRRRLHEYPEIGFDLAQTAALVSSELAGMGIEPTDRYGRSSVVGEIGQGEKLIAFRADMDALPIEETTDLPFRSKVPGRMHACGHDAHTGVLLAAAKYLKAHETELRCRVRFLFQPAEEISVSGAKMMTDNGAVDGVDEIVGIHCQNDLPVGTLGVRAGDYMAACVPVTVSFFGKTSHATLPQYGVDAIAMAHEAYGKMKEAVGDEAGQAKYIWSVGTFTGGKAHNVIADHAKMDITFRYFDADFARRAEKRVREICAEIAARYGGRCEVSWNESTGALYCDPAVTARFESAVTDAGIPVRRLPARMSSEDFAWYLTKTRGMLFRFGTENEALGCTALPHRSDFKIDEEGLKTGIRAFCLYALHQ